jgi:hypothetical protein
VTVGPTQAKLLAVDAVMAELAKNNVSTIDGLFEAWGLLSGEVQDGPMPTACPRSGRRRGCATACRLEPDR